ncbi:hypothetical protein BB560_005534 [Smittium megazygosporum]|uniref:Uncharacterized protein n=1 Tax=Smittium megazygosporum TaxID=133381 RepID=A0A2T9Z3Y1_9FUNG|nr:hypothetical protein BB560_005534 [Smittium megazygosporum]
MFSNPLPKFRLETIVSNPNGQLSSQQTISDYLTQQKTARPGLIQSTSGYNADHSSTIKDLRLGIEPSTKEYTYRQLKNSVYDKEDYILDCTEKIRLNGPYDNASVEKNFALVFDYTKGIERVFKFHGFVGKEE